ncbi:MAG TPA: tonB-system energizer ExbB, partial [Terriglobia bacterium]|nr:tonB-system energizer ExbB [Terriglobia bacterium]
MTAKLFLAPLFLAWGFLAVLPAKPVLAQQQVTAPAEANTSAQTVAPTATDSLSASPATNSPSAGEAAPAGSPPQPASSPPETVPADDAAALLLPHDLSPWGMFRNADLVVQLVMAGLAFASFVTWTVFFAKALHLLLLNRRMTAALRRLDDAPSLDQARASLGLRAGLGQVLVSAAVVELDLSGPAPVDGIKERIA